MAAEDAAQGRAAVTTASRPVTLALGAGLLGELLVLGGRVWLRGQRYAAIPRTTASMSESSV